MSQHYTSMRQNGQNHAEKCLLQKRFYLNFFVMQYVYVISKINNIDNFDILIPMGNGFHSPVNNHRPDLISIDTMTLEKLAWW